MPESVADYSTQVTTLERKLRALKREISGLVDEGKRALLKPQDTCSFEARLESNLKDWDQYQKAWDELDTIKAVVLNDEGFPSEAWQRSYDSTRDEIREGKAILLRIQRQSRSQIPLPQLTADQTTNISAFNSNKPQLPKIPIPTFSGDRLKWTHFRDTFLSLVHREPSLSNVEKFHYLTGALKGEAAVILSRYPVEAESYNLAWDKIVKTYDNPRILANLLVNRMVDRDTKAAKGEYQRYTMFLTDTADSIEAFRALKLENPCEFLLSALALRALDSETRKQFELSIDPMSFPSADDVAKFVRQRKSALEMSQNMGRVTTTDSSTYQDSSTSHNRVRYPNRSSPRYQSVSFHTSNNSNKQPASPRSYISREGSATCSSLRCLRCNGNHYLYHCEEFIRLPVQDRKTLVKSWKICQNCLKRGHKQSECRSKFKCRRCGQRHHTLIHEDTKTMTNLSRGSEILDDQTNGVNPIEEPETFIGFGSDPPEVYDSTVILGTARVMLKDNKGCYHPARALLDSGSQHSFITTSLVRALGVKVTPFSRSITSLAGLAIPKDYIKGTTSCVLRPHEGNHMYKFKPVVVDHITTALPSRILPSHLTETLRKHSLADRSFGVPGPIDVLIGGDLHNRLICGACRDSGIRNLYLLPTTFGLVVSGEIINTSVTTQIFFTESQPAIEAQLKQFWEMEEPQQADRSDPDLRYCEDHFLRTHSRTSQGRYVVRFPFDPKFSDLGYNRDVVYQRFHTLEHKLTKNPELSDHYSSFMQEYSSLGHMSPAVDESNYLIPHHGVWKETPHGPKLRVVFDASCPSSSFSLNDTLLAGPKLQNDLCSVLIQFRLYAIPLCADIAKMYRQILIHPSDRHFQHILWRDNTRDALREFELNTVTYGVKSSAFQAIRVIRQLVNDEGSNFPLAASKVITDMYVDDLVSGADSIEEASIFQQQLITLFEKGGFTLGKWATTVPSLIPNLESKADSIAIKTPDDDSLKILGLVWNSTSDSFAYTVSEPPIHNVTKRAMLSAIARIFDPLGLLAPVIFTAKTMIQEVWKANMDWDQVIPADLALRWKDLTTHWHKLSFISVPRYIGSAGAKFTLIGFCDASERGYAAALYLHAQGTDGCVNVSLIKAKTKLAPLKYVSIARLELCGALLLSRLIASAPNALALNFICFTDSIVVLNWLRTPTHALKTFEANRVAQISISAPAPHWRHVKSGDNPADLASRGCSPSTLKNEMLWWSGPEWSRRPIADWFEQVDDTLAMSTFSPANKGIVPIFDWLSRISSFLTAVRTMARLIRVVRKRSSDLQPCSGPITAGEFRYAEMSCARFVQRLHLPKILFEEDSMVPKPYCQLAPFVDEIGLIRVGGRLNKANLTDSSKHPILLPRHASFSRLVIEHLHRTHFHSGQSLTLALLRGKYWVPRATQLIKSCILRCVHCRIIKAKPTTPFMASLPLERVSGFRAFANVGVDYAGPFLIKESNRRNAPLGKAYLCLFVCMASKALHLEVVSSLSTPAFLSALERFISRRGAPCSIWSDHGSNFVGASRFIKDVYNFQRQIQNTVIDKLASKGIEWKFIPPRAPHFGGLWEAGVKCAKGLLTRSIGKQPYTLEELMTAFAKIEALLNSRPLNALNEDVEDYNFLTPGHFITGASLITLPEPSSPQTNSTSPARWRLLQSQTAHIWDRWRKEYLHTLQQRAKWFKRTPNLQVGELVILLDKRPLIGHWPVGRVVYTFPGRDGITRAVTVRTPSGTTLTRAVTSLAPLFYTKEDS